MTARVNIRHRTLPDGRVVPIVDRAMVDRAEAAVAEHANRATTPRDLAKAALRGALGPDLIIDREKAAA